MRILLIDLYAGSEGMGMEFRPFYMARQWMRLGHSVLVAAASFSHLRSRNPRVTRRFERRTVEGVPYLFVRTPAYCGNNASRGRNILAFVNGLRLIAGRVAREFRPDAVVCSSTCPLDVRPGAAIARRAGAALFFEIHDLWPLTPMVMGKMSKWNPVIFTMQRAEDYAFRHAARIISILPNTDAYVRARGFDASKWVYVPNGVFAGEVPSGSASPDGASPDGASPGAAGPPAAPAREAADCETAARLRNLHRQGFFLVGYTGNHARASALTALLDAARLLKGEAVRFALIGNGIDKPRLVEYARRHGCGNVLFFDPVPKACMGSVLAALDVCYMGLARSPLFRYGVSPNKLYDYLLARKPVIYAVDAPNDPVRDAGCGRSVPAEDAHAVARAVLELRDAGPALLREMGRRGRAYVAAHNDYPALAARYLRALEDGVRDTRRARGRRG